MVWVKPGDETGEYYIIVAGLPWNCTWQKLKDYSRNQQLDGKCIEIDLVMVFPESTDGWVRVKGKENFRKALEHLKHGVIENKCIVVDGRNETEMTFLRDSMGPVIASHPRRQRNGNSSECDTFPSPTPPYHGNQSNVSLASYSGTETWYVQPQAAQNCSPISPTLPYYQQPPQIFEAPPSVPVPSPGDYFRPLAPNMMYIGEMTTTTPVYIAHVPQPQVYPSYVTPIPYTEPTYSPPAGIKTEQRKIVITQLPHSTTYPQLEELLQKHIRRILPKSATDPYDELEELKIATHSNKKPRGHAFAILSSPSIARAVVKSLDGLRFHSRTLCARLAKEGVEPSKRYPPPPEPSQATQLEYQHPVETYTAAPSSPSVVAVKSVVAEAASSDGTVKRSGSSRQRASTPLVVNGSSSESSRERDDKKKKHRN